MRVSDEEELYELFTKGLSEEEIIERVGRGLEDKVFKWFKYVCLKRGGKFTYDEEEQVARCDFTDRPRIFFAFDSRGNFEIGAFEGDIFIREEEGEDVIKIEKPVVIDTENAEVVRTRRNRTWVCKRARYIKLAKEEDTYVIKVR